MELEYLKVLKQHGVSEKELPEDALEGIKEIKSTVRIAKLRESKGESPDKYFKKVKTLDKWVTYEILDFINDSDENGEKPEFDDDDADKNNGKADADKNNDDSGSKKEKTPTGDPVKINMELAELFKNGKTDLTISEIKSIAPNCYDTIFDCYEDGEENGIETSEFSLLEYEEQKYKITKK